MTRKQKAVAMKILRARVQGTEWDEIAQSLGLSSGARAEKLFYELLDQYAGETFTPEGIARARALELLKLEMAEEPLYRAVAQGGNRAIFAAERLARLSERRAKLLGLDSQTINLNTQAPIRIEGDLKEVLDEIWGVKGDE